MDSNEIMTVKNERARGYFTRLFLAVMLLTLVNFGIQLGVAYLFAYKFTEIYDSWWFTWILSLVPLYCIALPLFMLVLPKNDIPLPQKEKLSAPGVLLALLISLATMGVSNYVSFFIVEAIRMLSRDLLFSRDALNEIISDTPIYVTVLATCVIAPIGEEFIFRKLLIDRTLPFGELSSCLISGILFGLFHGNLRQAIYASALGFVLAYVYVKTRNIIYPIIMHAAVNLCGAVIAPAIANFGTEGLTAIENGDITVQSVIAILLLLGFFAVGGAVVIGGIVATVVMLCKKKIRFTPPTVALDVGRLGVTVINNPGAIALLCVFASIIIRSAVIK